MFHLSLANAYERAINRKGAIDRIMAKKKTESPLFSSEYEYQQFRNRALHLRARVNGLFFLKGNPFILSVFKA